MVSMRMKSFFSALLLLGLLASPKLAHAQLTTDDYRTALDEATAIYKLGDYSAALFAYLEVRSKFGGPEIDYSLARTYHKLYRCEDAQTFYLFVMNTYDLPEEDALFQRAAKYYEELLSCPDYGQVTLECSDLGASLMVNGEPIGTCPSKPFQMPDGDYTFTLSNSEGEKVEDRVVVASGASERVVLELPEKVVTETIEVPVEVGVKKETNWLAWSLVGVGAASLTASAFTNSLGYAAMADVQKAADEGDSSARQQAEDDVAMQQMLTGITFGVGLAAAGTGVVLLILDSLDEGTDTANAGLEFDFGLSGESGQLSLRQRF